MSRLFKNKNLNWGMEKRVTVKSERDEYRLFRSRAIIAAILVFIALLLVFTRLVYLQVTHHDYYTAKSKENYQKKIPIPPVRGFGPISRINPRRTTQCIDLDAAIIRQRG